MENYKTMKQLLYLITAIGLISCNSDLKVSEKQTKFTIDSVEYHGISQDNTLQFDPYWKLHLKECDMWTRSHFKYHKGDTIVVTVKSFNNSTNWYNYNH